MSEIIEAEEDYQLTEEELRILGLSSHKPPLQLIQAPLTREKQTR